MNTLNLMILLFSILIKLFIEHESNFSVVLTLLQTFSLEAFVSKLYAL